MLTPMDQIAAQNLQMIKAAVSYLPSQNQKLISVLLKLIEIRNLLHFYDTHSGMMRTCSTASSPPGVLDMLTDMRTYCEGSEQAMIDQWIQLLSVMELSSMMSGTPDFAEQLASIFGKETIL